MLVQYVLMAIFFGVIAAIPVMWYLLGIKSYGTGDYHQP
jgi:biopolymer transport protein ExbB/TolQ